MLCMYESYLLYKRKQSIPKRTKMSSLYNMSRGFFFIYLSRNDGFFSFFLVNTHILSRMYPQSSFWNYRSSSGNCLPRLYSFKIRCMLNIYLRIQHLMFHKLTTQSIVNHIQCYYSSLFFIREIPYNFKLARSCFKITNILLEFWKILPWNLLSKEWTIRLKYSISSDAIW